MPMFDQGGELKRIIILAVAVCALALAGTAAAALIPGTFDPGNTNCPKVKFGNGVLHLEKNCDTTVNAAAGADITGLEGQSFTSASFTLASASQCQGGSPRFNVETTTGFFFLGCNNVIPTSGPNGVTYTFTPATIQAGGNQVPVPTGTIKSISILIDVHGTADISDITVNGVEQLPNKDACKNGGWQNFDPAFKNQGECVSSFVGS
jgi:hypothetical protein